MYFASNFVFVYKLLGVFHSIAWNISNVKNDLFRQVRPITLHLSFAWHWWYVLSSPLFELRHNVVPFLFKLHFGCIYFAVGIGIIYSLFGTLALNVSRLQCQAKDWDIVCKRLVWFYLWFFSYFSNSGMTSQASLQLHLLCHHDWNPLWYPW